MSLPVKLLLAILLVVCASCGGGGGGGGGGTGGGGGGTVSLFGRAIWAGTGAGPNPAATVRSGDASTLTSLADGGFAFDVPTGATSVSVTAPVGAGTVVRTFSFPAATVATELGDLYIGPEEVTLTGTVRDSSTGGALAGAQIKVAGRTGTTGADGRFSIPGVGYASTALGVFLGIQGEVARASYFNSFFAPPSAPVGGAVDVGTISLTPTGGADPPPPPINLTVNVSPDGGGATVRVRSGGTVIRTATSGAAGSAGFWVPAGSYTVEVTKGAKTGSSPATVANVAVPVSVNVVIS